MSPNHRWSDEPDDESDDAEYPEDPGFGNPETDTIRCPECGTDVYDDAVQCPSCGHYLEADTNPWSGRSLWWIVVGLLGVVAAVAAVIGLAQR
jgi:hypothetical protein